MGDQGAQAQQLGGRQGRIEIGQHQRLFQPAISQHRLEPLADACPQKWPLRIEHEARQAHVLQQRRTRVALPMHQGPACRFEYFIGAQGPLRIAGPQLRGSLGIAFCQAGMQCLDTDANQQGARLGANFRRNRWDVGKPVGQRREVEPGAADEDGNLLHHPHLFQSPARIACVTTHGISLAGGDMAIEKMRRAGTRIGIRLRRQNRCFGIDLHGIGIDHRAANMLRQCQSRGGLAARGGACNKHGVNFHRSSMSAFVLNVIGDGAASELFAPLGLGKAHILSPGRAFDLPVATQDREPLLAAARSFAEGLKLDINVVATAKRKKKLLIADMDSTIINVECLDELADMAGLKPQIAAITERAMRGELEFEAALRERVGMLKGLGLDALERTYVERVRLNPGAKNLLATMRANGAHTMLVSGGFGYFTSRVAEAAGFHVERGNTLLDDGVALTGQVATPILGREAKLQALEETVANLNLDYAETLAVGDGANDLAMIQRAGMGVAYHAKPVVAAAAGASIDHNDLTALLYLQGYTDAEIVAA
jgi:phosphoserine phosphatase